MHQGTMSSKMRFTNSSMAPMSAMLQSLGWQNHGFGTEGEATRDSVIFGHVLCRYLR